MADHPRLGAYSMFHVLPRALFEHVLGFIREPRQVTLHDLGSVSGTYVKVRFDVPIIIREGMTFLVGNDINIDIESVVAYDRTDIRCEEEVQEELNLTMPNFPHINLTISKIPADNEDITISS
jgi:pSer/pThr/pTyr-binding forkhead associated (FHA) protein